MQEYSQSNQDGTRDSIEKYERLVFNNQEGYFDVHQIEYIYDFYNEKNLLDKAESVLKMGLKLHPSSTSLQIKYSTLLLDRNENEKALDILNYIKKIESNNAEIFLNIGLIHLREDNKKEAISHFESAVRLATSEELEDFIFEIAFNLNQEQFYLEARNLLNNYYNKFSQNEGILFELAYAFDKLNEIDESISTYNKLLDINPYLENAWYNLGILYNKKEDYINAIEAYDMTIAIDPDLPEAYYNKGNSLAQIAEFKEAIDNYIEYLSMGYPGSLTYYYIGDCWDNLGNHDLASKFYQMALDFEPDNYDALKALGRAAYITNDYATSVYAYDKALSITPDSADLWLWLGKSYKKMQKPFEAKKCLKKALVHKHEDTKSWIEMYQFLEENESSFDPVPFLKRLLEKDETNGALHYLASIIYKKCNNENEAFKHLVIARQLLPEDLELVLNEYPELVTLPDIAEYINTMEE